MLQSITLPSGKSWAKVGMLFSLPPSLSSMYGFSFSVTLFFLHLRNWGLMKSLCFIWTESDPNWTGVELDTEETIQVCFWACAMSPQVPPRPTLNSTSCACKKASVPKHDCGLPCWSLKETVSAQGEWVLLLLAAFLWLAFKVKMMMCYKRSSVSASLGTWGGWNWLML